MTPMRELTDKELDAVSGGDAVLTVLPPNPVVEGIQRLILGTPPHPIVARDGVVSIIPTGG
jgi:bacteriocin-like protein